MPPARIRLLEADPDLGRFLLDEDLREARQLTVPLVTFSRDEQTNVTDALEAQGAFAALLLSGMALEQIQIADQIGMRPIGPGDILSVNPDAPSILVGDSTARAIAGTQIALLGREVLLATGRWPALTIGLQARYTQQASRLATQLVICQLPRVDQRLLAVLWLLAESWGRVTPVGTALPLRLTHDVLGSLVGARRPTVTLALRDLSERGAVVRQDQGWMLLEEPPGAARAFRPIRPPILFQELSDAHVVEGASAEDGSSLEALYNTVALLRERHQIEKRRFEERVILSRAVRTACQENRERVSRDRLRRRRPRSS